MHSLRAHRDSSLRARLESTLRWPQRVSGHTATGVSEHTSRVSEHAATGVTEHTSRAHLIGHIGFQSTPREQPESEGGVCECLPVMRMSGIYSRLFLTKSLRCKSLRALRESSLRAHLKSTPHRPRWVSEHSLRAHLVGNSASQKAAQLSAARRLPLRNELPLSFAAEVRRVDPRF